jgi:SH3-like domain-containing protein
MRHALAAALALLALAGCSKTPPAGQAPAAPAAGGAPAATAPAAAPTTPRAFVTAVTALRKEATDASKIPGGKDGKEQANYLTTLYRGEQVDVLETKEDWARVKSSADAEGWLKRAAILEAEGVAAATVLVPTDVFDRPDLLAANAKKKIEPGTLVLVVRSRPPFSEVNVSGSQNAWVLAERLTSDEKDVQVAKLIEKSRYLVRANKKDEALQNLALLRSTFPGVALVDVLATELGVTPPPGADAGSAVTTPAAADAQPAADAPPAQAPAQ